MTPKTGCLMTNWMQRIKRNLSCKVNRGSPVCGNFLSAPEPRDLRRHTARLPCLTGRWGIM